DAPHSFHFGTRLAPSAKSASGALQVPRAKAGDRSLDPPGRCRLLCERRAPDAPLSKWPRGEAMSRFLSAIRCAPVLLGAAVAWFAPLVGQAPAGTVASRRPGGTVTIA